MSEPFGVVTFDSTRWRDVRSWFLGIGYDDDSIVLGGEGFRLYVAEHGMPGPEGFAEGRYLAVLDRADYFSVLADPMGQDAFYYYSPERLEVDGAPVSRWAVSNSLLSVVRRARSFGSVELYRPSVFGFQVSAGKAIGAQLFSNNTPVAGARVLPLGCELRISKIDGSASLHRLRSGDWLTADDGRDYVELLSTYVRRSLRLCAALRAAGNLDRMCDVSGGHDSRAVMAMLERAGGAAPVVYTTDTGKADDYRVAKRLARHYGIRLSLQAQVPVSVDGPAAFDIWAHGSAGVYLPIVMPRARHAGNRLRFHGGNFLSKEFGELPATQKVRSFGKWIKTGDDGTLVEREFLDSFGHIDMDVEAPFAMQMHYINFRGRFHYGRNWYSYTRAPMITPLISPLLARAAFRLTPEAYNHSQVSLDLLMALDTALGTIPFDLPEKDFSMASVAQSPYWKRPVAADAVDHAGLPRIYAAPSPEAGEAGDCGKGPAFMDVFLAKFPQLLERVREARLFDDNYLDQAKREAAGPGPGAHHMRAAAHVAHTGLFLEETGC